MNLFFSQFRRSLSFSDRQLAVVSSLFPLAYFAEYLMSAIQQQPQSPKVLFVIWYSLVALYRPRLYPVSISLFIIALFLAAVLQQGEKVKLSNFLAIAAFFLIVITLLQLILVQWQSRRQH